MPRFENPGTVGHLLLEAAEAHGEHVFLYFEDIQLSYAQMADAAARVAAGFRHVGIARGDRIGLLLPNDTAFLQTWFGAALAGAVIVPINPAYKREEVRYILENAGACAIVTSADRTSDVDAVADVLPDLAHKITTGEAAGDWSAFGGFAGHDARLDGADVDPDDEAAIIYTSGTTGHPKGVVLTHSNYHFDTWSLTTHLRTTARDRFLCFLPLFHVNAQVVSVLTAVLSGGSLILLREFKPQTFFEALSRHRATTFSAVPTVYAILNTLPDAERYDLSSLRYCVCGAAPMPIEVFNAFEERFGATIVEGYGLSEATCGTCVNPVGTDEVRKIGSIGLPLPDQEMAVFDDAGRALPAGEVGEIVVRGKAVMKGYFRNEQASREVLRDGWLHTGDLGHRDEDGYFFIVGRKKEMIIRGGENIYPKEIEEVIYRHPAVQEAAVIGIPDDVWGETVWACIVPRSDAKPDPDELRSFLREHLAEFKVPAVVRLFESFPKTATGKIQKRKLVDAVIGTT